MKRLLSITFVIALLGSACGADAPPAPSDDGIAALEKAGSPEPERTSNKKTDKKKVRRAGKSAENAANAPGDDAAAAPSSGPKGPAGAEGQSATGGARPGRTTVAAAIPDGRYQYTTQGERSVSGNREDLPEVTTLTAQNPSNGEQRQLRDLRDSDGNGTLTESRLLYRSDGVYLTYVKVTSKFQGGLTDVREFKLPQPALIAPAGARPVFKRSFTMQGSGTRADVTLKAIAYDKIAIGDSTVRALVVETKIVFSGTLEGRQTSVSWFWPKHVLTLKEQVDTDVSNGPIRLQSSYEATLRELP